LDISNTFRGRDFWGGYKEDRHQHAMLFVPTKGVIVINPTRSDHVDLSYIALYPYH